MADQVFLERAQIDLLAKLVEATRRSPERVSFEFLHFADSRTLLVHPGIGQDFVPFGDLAVLENERLVLIRRDRHDHGHFDLSSEGLRLYEEWRVRNGEPVRQLEQDVLRYLRAEQFRKTFPAAEAKWSAAAALLWKTESTAEASVIGHLCRESMQEFAEEACNLSKLTPVPGRKTDIVLRIRQVLQGVRSDAGRKHLEALLAYWGTVSDLVQRQEHGGQREAEAIVWDDARCVVFHTAVVMFEIGAVLQRPPAV